MQIIIIICLIGDDDIVLIIMDNLHSPSSDGFIVNFSEVGYCTISENQIYAAIFYGDDSHFLVPTNKCIEESITLQHGPCITVNTMYFRLRASKHRSKTNRRYRRECRTYRNLQWNQW